MGVDTPKQLLNTVFLYVGKRGVEQRSLKFSVLATLQHYVYVENRSKTTREPTLGLKTRLFRFIQTQNVGQDVLCV